MQPGHSHWLTICGQETKSGGVDLRTCSWGSRKSMPATPAFVVSSIFHLAAACECEQPEVRRLRKQPRPDQARPDQTTCNRQQASVTERRQTRVVGDLRSRPPYNTKHHQGLGSTHSSPKANGNDAHRPSRRSICVSTAGAQRWAGDDRPPLQNLELAIYAVVGGEGERSVGSAVGTKCFHSSPCTPKTRAPRRHRWRLSS